MSSLFASVDRNTKNSSQFWQIYDFSNPEIIYNCDLIELSKTGEFKKKNYSLSQNFLFKHRKDLKFISKMCQIQWKQVQPFVEERKSEKLYGFRLGHKNSYQDFYVDKSEDLDVWIEHLSDVSIMTDIENDFKFIKHLGKGRYSNVYLGVYLETSAKYAIKSIKKSTLSAMKNGMASLINEIQIMKKLRHPNIVRLHKVYENETNIHLVLDYLEGGDLLDRIKTKKSLPEDAVLSFAKNMLGVLEYISSLNIVHRDIKLENILMTSQNSDSDFKLADYGMATFANDELTMRCGSPGYVAPEILRKKSYGAKVDMFSLGVVLYILLHGKVPFSGKNLDDVLRRNKACIISYSEISENKVSRPAVKLLKNMLDPEPESRISPSEALKHIWFNLKFGIKSLRRPLAFPFPLIPNESVSDLKLKRCEEKEALNLPDIVTKMNKTDNSNVRRIGKELLLDEINQLWN